jgi:lysozyme
LKPAVDPEFLVNCRTATCTNPVKFKQELRTFLDLVERRTSKPTLLYLTQEFGDAYQVSARFDRPSWPRRIIFELRFGARPWSAWQASNFRRLDGIHGRVGWNVARLTWPPQPPHSKP